MTHISMLLRMTYIFNHRTAQDVPKKYMELTGYCASYLDFETRRAVMAKNIKNQAAGKTGAVMTEEFLRGVAGWDLKPSKRMGIALWWVSDEGIAARQAQCLANSTKTPVDPQKCGQKNCEVCNPVEV